MVAIIHRNAFADRVHQPRGARNVFEDRIHARGWKEGLAERFARASRFDFKWKRCWQPGSRGRFSVEEASSSPNLLRWSDTHTHTHTHTHVCREFFVSKLYNNILYFLNVFETEKITIFYYFIITVNII